MILVHILRNFAEDVRVNLWSVLGSRPVAFVTPFPTILTDHLLALVDEEHLADELIVLGVHCVRLRCL